MDNSNKDLPNNPFLTSSPQTGANPTSPTPTFDPNSGMQPPPSPAAPTSSWDPNPIPTTPAQSTTEGVDPLASYTGEPTTSSFDQQNAVPQDQPVTTPTFIPSPPPPFDPNPPQSTTPSSDYPTSFNQTYPQPSQADTSWNPLQPNPTTAPIPQTPAANTSPLDNPWGAPIQPPAIDGSNQAPTFAPDTSTPNATNAYPTTLGTEQTYPVQSAQIPDPTTMNPNIPSSPPPWVPQANTPESSDQNSANSITTNEPAPTDLSHLINSGATEVIQPSSEPETLVAPAGVPEVPTVPTEGGKGFPKWLIGVGIGLLLIVGGASAYFILGIGQPPKTTTSIPATTVPNTNQAKPPAAAATQAAQPTSTPEASGSANFGQLQGGSQTATSAADLLRQRQQGR